MNTTEIKRYEKLQSTISNKKQELESNQLTLQVAQEDLTRINRIVVRGEALADPVTFEISITTLNSEKTLIEADWDEVRNRKRDTRDAINASTEEVESLTNEMLAMPAEERSEIQAQILALEATIETKTKELSSIENEKQNLEGKITSVENEITKLNGEFSANEQTLQTLYAEKQNKENFVNQSTTTLASTQQVLNDKLEEFEQISDPRTLVEGLADDTPFLLFPIRLETRFMTVKHVRKVMNMNQVPIQSQNQASTSAPKNVQYLKKLDPVPIIVSQSERVVEDEHELWVRIVPDDIAIHTHEDRLTLDELEAGKNYWEAIWPDVTDEDLRVAAWRVVVNSYNAERAAWIVKETEPTNIGTATYPTPLIFPSLVIKPGTWTNQPKSKIMPDRFVARVYKDEVNYREVIGNMIPDPLPVGMDPSSADLDTSFDQVDNKVDFPDELKWMTDFEKAEEIGMAIRIPLQDGEKIAGFEKLFVLGLKLSENKENSKLLIEELFDNHHYTNGFSLLPQGTPTNNTDELSSGFNGKEIGHEESYATELGDPLFTSEADRFKKTDGQWFSELLGLSNTTMEHVRYADRYDQREGMAMNTSLWPATMGYYLKQMMAPIVTPKMQEEVAKFYCEHIIARGRVPSFRVDSQPYGILATTAFSKWKFSTSYEQSNPEVTNMVKNVLFPLDNEFSNLVGNVINSETGGDVQDNFLKMLGLHASSVEYHQRFASGQYFSWNLLKYFQNAPNDAVPGTTFPVMNDSIPDGLKNIYTSNLGFSLGITPRILQLLFVKNERLLDGPVIDMEVLPLSEKRGIQPFPSTETNYIEWMLSSDFNQIREEDFTDIVDVLDGQKPPKALLYLLLRHGCLLQYINTAVQILLEQNIAYPEAELEFELHKEVNNESMSVEEGQLVTNLVTAEVTYEFEAGIERNIQQLIASGNLAESQRESAKQQMREERGGELDEAINTQVNERLQQYSVEVSKWDYLTQKHPEVTNNKSLLQYILDDMVIGGPHTECLQKIKSSLEVLMDMPTARLERCMAESLDTCNYRLDAWLLGIVNQRLEQQAKDGISLGKTGSFIGSFGMLEHLSPNASFPGIHVVEIDDTNGGNSPNFVYVGTDERTELEYDAVLGKVVVPPRINPENLGFIHGPSVNHAVAAAILRAGYAGHQGTDSPDSALAVNLRSDRVRKALFYLEGVKNGQELASLLGYQFERTLHDLDAGLDEYILDIRRLFPIIANGLVADDPAETSIESFEARNVVDGLQLIENYRDNPTGWDTDISPAIPTSERDLIVASIDKIVDHMDAIGDLMMSEGMFQVATGNHERAGAVIKALGEGNVIPDPQIIKTPRLDKVFMQRKAVLFDTQLGDPEAWAADESARSYSEPALNYWLKTVLPDPNSVLINYEYTLAVTPIDGQLTLSQLGLQPIDLLYMLTDQGSSQDGTELSSLVNYVIIHSELFVETPVSIKFIDRDTMDPEDITIFELLPLIKSIQEMIGQGRVATPSDFVIEGEVYAVEQAALPTQGMDLSNIESRLTEALGPATTVGRKGLRDVKLELSNAMDDADLLVTIPGNEGVIDILRDKLLLASKFAVSGAIPESAYEYSIETRNILSAQATRIISQLTSIEVKAADGFLDLASIVETPDRLDKLQEIAEFLFGRSFKVFPEFIFYNQADIDASRLSTTLLASAGDFGIDEWLQGISKVRPKMSNYHFYSMVEESLTANTSNREVIQLPHDSHPDSRWLGASLVPDYETPDEAISLVLDLPNNYMTAPLQSGLILDEWTESIPETNAITGVAINFDQPNSEAPNTLLLAVTPEETGRWKWNDLMDTLNETLMMAKKRAIDPDIINANSPLGHALPALVAAIEAGDTAPGLDFSRNIVDADAGQVGPISVAAYSPAAPE